MLNANDPHEAGRPVVNALQAEDHNRTGDKAQGFAPLFHPRTRDDALHTANELNAAAVRLRTAALEHPGTIGHSLDRLAGHYAGRARDWFSRADGYPSEARA